MAVPTTENRLHIEQDFSRYSKIASRLLGENGSLWVNDTSEGDDPDDYQPAIGTRLNTGGAIRLVECIGVRPGSTIQGFKSTTKILSEKVYGIHSPSPLYFTGWYLVKASQLPDEFANVFSQLSAEPGTAMAGRRDITATLPKSGTFSANCFRNIFNDHFAQATELIVSEDSAATQAILPELVQTMEVVGQDTLDITYDDMIYLITGYYPKNNKSQLLRFQLSKGSLVTPQLAIPANADPMLAGHFGAVHKHSMQKNMICIEPSFLCLLAGVWEQPNNNSVYSQNTGIDRYQESDTGEREHTIDRGAGFAVDGMRNLTAWLVDPTTTDPIGDLGSVATLNYWLNGDVQFDYDWDPIVVSGAAGGAATLTPEATEGAEAYVSRVDQWTGISTLQGFSD